MRKTTKQAARSQERPGLPKHNPSGLPYGTGSFQLRGRSYWIMYRDAEGRTVQENAKTGDAGIARLMVAERALVTARAKVAALEAIFNEAGQAGYAPTTEGWQRTSGPGRQPDDDGGQRGTRSRSVPKDSKVRPQRKGQKGARS
jgi:hypothetical protein